MESVRIILNQAIDYAGLFPPAALAMGPALRNYAQYRTGPYAWALGSFILPLSRLKEFEDSLPAVAVDATWRLSVLAGPDLQASLRTVSEFNSRHKSHAGLPAVVIDAIEIKASNPDEIVEAGHFLSPTLHSYFEIPGSTEASPFLSAIRRVKSRAKMRTGGLTADAIPSSPEVDRFIRACCGARLRFKVTAGLHHALRSVHPLTRAPGGPSGLMHGFLNIFLASAFIYAGMEPALSRVLLEERSGESFRFDDEGVEWRSHRLGCDYLRRARSLLAVSFGSCSFEEPMEDLKQLNLLAPD